jgi:integrase
VFPSPTTDRPIENPQKAAERLRERSKVADLRLHDLRRTAASLMTGMGLSPDGHEDPEPRRAR